MKKQVVVIASIVGLVVVFLLATQTYKTEQVKQVQELVEKPAVNNPLDSPNAMTWGPPEAKVTIVEFFDPACETCAMMAGPVRALMESHPGRVRMVYRYAPFHPGSEDVVKILEASRKQDRYFAVLDLMFASQQFWASHHDPNPDMLWKVLPRAGVDVDKLRSEMGGKDIAALVQKDTEDAGSLGVRKTPTYFVNGKPLASFGLPQLQALVDSEIAANY